jgi:hypothetical protein
MTKKNGNINFFFAGIAIALGVSFLFKKNDIKDLKNKTSIDQYRNRLKEFFLEEDINKAIGEMCQFINHGINPEDAFHMVIQESNVERF